MLEAAFFASSMISCRRASSASPASRRADAVGHQLITLRAPTRSWKLRVADQSAELDLSAPRARRHRARVDAPRLRVASCRPRATPADRSSESACLCPTGLAADITTGARRRAFVSSRLWLIGIAVSKEWLHVGRGLNFHSTMADRRWPLERASGSHTPGIGRSILNALRGSPRCAQPCRSSARFGSATRSPLWEGRFD